MVPKSDDGSTNGSIFEEWGRVSLQAGDAFGKTLRIVDEARAKMIAAGFTDVTERRFKCPIGPWARDPRLKELGLYNRLQWEEGIEGWTMMLLTKVLNVRLSIHQPSRPRRGVLTELTLPSTMSVEPSRGRSLLGSHEKRPSQSKYSRISGNVPSSQASAELLCLSF